MKKNTVWIVGALTAFMAAVSFGGCSSARGVFEATYGEPFFEENVLLAVALQTSNSAQSYVVDSVAFDGARLTVWLKEKNLPPDTDGAAVMGEQYCFIRLAKNAFAADEIDESAVDLIFFR